MQLPYIEQLFAEKLITEQEYPALKQQLKQPVSLYTDLHTIIYTGIILFSTGLGVVIYENINSIGHGFIVAVISLLCIGCFAYCIKKSRGFFAIKKSNTITFADYVLLLGCLLLLTLTGYLQYQFDLFGDHWGLATFVPMVLLFLSAYYFDHIGVLSLGITNLAAWAGITVAPLNFIRDNNFSSSPYLIYTGISLGIGLFITALLSEKNNFKPHFSYTYRNFSIHLLFISLLAGLFYYDTLYLIWFLFILAATAFMWRQAISKKSFYFLVVTAIYGYVAVSYVVIRFLSAPGKDISIYTYIIWFIASGVALMKLFIHYNKILNQHA